MESSKNKKSTKSVEELHHFSCIHCEKWWTIGDAPKGRSSWYCPWCGKENHFKA